MWIGAGVQLQELRPAIKRAEHRRAEQSLAHGWCLEMESVGIAAGEVTEACAEASMRAAQMAVWKVRAAACRCLVCVSGVHGPALLMIA